MAQKRNDTTGFGELRSARAQSRGLYWGVALFSIFVNLLMLTGPIYMLQVYDRVLGSRSVETLLALSLLVVFLYAMMGILDYVRGRVMGRAGARFQATLDRRVFDASLRKAARQPGKGPQTGLQDLESIQRLYSSPVLLAMFDIPWTPFFLAGIALFHPWLGMLAVGGGAVLILITLINQMTTRRPAVQSGAAGQAADNFSDQLRKEAEAVRALGMTDATFARWQKARGVALSEGLKSADLGGTFQSMTKTLRLFLQSAMLGLGAYLVILGELTPGAMIAGSILLGRALAPIEQTIGSWPAVQRAMRGWSDLGDLLSEVPAEKERTALPKPRAYLALDQVSIVPPGETAAALRMLSFELRPGTACGVIGPSGAGKSTLARALTGVWPPVSGAIRLDGAALDQYDPSVLGGLIGYLPQQVQLFDGTIADNIARMAPAPDAEKVVEAAKKAAAHQMILDLPQGYDTPVSAAGTRLSGGQMQRIGLARAMYGDPVILVLDEPNSNLDNAGSNALNKAIRDYKAAGHSILIMAHRPAAIVECDLLLVIENGMRRAFGPRDDVLKDTVKNAPEIAATQKAGKMGGVT